MRFNSFDKAITVARDSLRNAPVVKTTSWQGLEGKPELATREVLNFSFTVNSTDIPSHELITQVGPDLPWADDHFKERVGGEPLNPPPSEAWWPWAPKGNESFKEGKWGPVRSSGDWAYLAGLIDGDGSLGKSDEGRHARIKITQLDGEYLTKVYESFGVGTIRPYSTPTNKLSDKGSTIWRISKREEVRWVLENIIPYLKLKKAKAAELLAELPSKDGRANTQEFGKLNEPMFSHTYPERYWATKFMGNTPRGIRFNYGDLGDLVKLLADDPMTRQAYLPVWFPEDLGAPMNERKPCTLGYHFIMRNDRLHIVYYIRSCDFLRHFRNDIYMTTLLQHWVLNKLRGLSNGWLGVEPGNFTMHITSLHLFVNDYQRVFG